MPSAATRWIYLCAIVSVFILALHSMSDFSSRATAGLGFIKNSLFSTGVKYDPFPWKTVDQRYSVTSMLALPTDRPLNIPKVQYDFRWRTESNDVKSIREKRQKAVKESFAHAWEGYKAHGWMRDEIAPISGGSRDVFGGWAATLIDSLDTLWIMGFKKEFNNAIHAIQFIDFTKASVEDLNVFETTIRYLGGLLAAYDLSGNRVLLDKAIQLGEMLYHSFDTPNRMPICRWKWKEAAEGKPQEANDLALVAEVGSLSMEFTRLSQLSGDPKYFDATQRVMNHFYSQQNNTKLPGMWPLVVNPKDLDFTKDNTFSLGAMSDSLYEYLPKQYLLLGGLHSEYKIMYKRAIEVAKEHNLFRPLNKDNKNILISGIAKVDGGKVSLTPEGQHLVCFAGGMIGLASQIFGLDDIVTARKLVDGCIWACESMPTGVMPETFRAIPCTGECQWDKAIWHREVLDHETHYEGLVEDMIREKHLQPGFVDIPDKTYILRPEVIESLFILYRITGDTSLQEKAWDLFCAIEEYTRTDIAHASLADVTVPVPPQSDRMESFWTAETLKYFYLIFGESTVLSLDEYVFNTEAHPFKRPSASTGWS